MLLITISVSSLLSISALSFYLIKAKRNFKDLHAKYTACQKFADESADTILRGEEKRSALTKQVVELVSKVAQLNGKIATLEVPRTPTPKTEAATPGKPNNKRPYNKRKNTKKAD